MAPSTIFITGAARGIGLQLVKKFASLSPAPTLILTGVRDPEKATNLQAFAKESKVKIEILRLDVSNVASIEAAFSRTKELCPNGLNLLINNAGVFPCQGEPEKVNFESMELGFRVNTVGSTIMTKTFHPLLKLGASKKGWKDGGALSTTQAGVVMISSNLGSCGSVPYPGVPTTFDFMAYGATKSAINMVTKCLSVEYAKDGVLVACLHPGWVKTEMGGSDGNLTVEQAVDFIVPTIMKMEPGKYYSYDFAETGKYLLW